jgi:WD40 repeat protein
MSVSFSADGSRLVSCGADSLIRVWYVESKDCRLLLRGHADEVFDAKFHPDGSRIASGGRDGLVRIWDAATGEQFVRLPSHADFVFSLAWISQPVSDVDGGAILRNPALTWLRRTSARKFPGSSVAADPSSLSGH